MTHLFINCLAAPSLLGRDTGCQVYETRLMTINARTLLTQHSRHHGVLAHDYEDVSFLRPKLHLEATLPITPFPPRLSATTTISPTPPLP